MKDRFVSHNFSQSSKSINRLEEFDSDAELEEDYPDHEQTDSAE